MKYVDEKIIDHLMALLNISFHDECGRYSLDNDSLASVWYRLNYYAEVKKVNINSIYHIISNKTKWYVDYQHVS